MRASRKPFHPPCELAPLGWRCSRGYGHVRPCALRPAWWNLPVRWMTRA